MRALTHGRTNIVRANNKNTLILIKGIGEAYINEEIPHLLQVVSETDYPPKISLMNLL